MHSRCAIVNTVWLLTVLNVAQIRAFFPSVSGTITEDPVTGAFVSPTAIALQTHTSFPPTPRHQEVCTLPLAFGSLVASPPPSASTSPSFSRLATHAHNLHTHSCSFILSPCFRSRHGPAKVYGDSSKGRVGVSSRRWVSAVLYFLDSPGCFLLNGGVAVAKCFTIDDCILFVFLVVDCFCRPTPLLNPHARAGIATAAGGGGTRGATGSSAALNHLDCRHPISLILM